MNTFLKNFKLKFEKTSLNKLLVYMLLAYTFGVLIRLILWNQLIPMESFWIDGDPLPIYSPDAGLYGFYAKELLSGAVYPFDAEHMPGYLIYWIVGIFSVNIDWVMFLLPAFLAPLVVVPIILMAEAYYQARLGFFAALIGVIGINFYTRSYLGYMDTDALNLFFPYMAIASFMMALVRRSVSWGVVGVVSLVAFHFWYHSSLAIIASILLMLLLLALFVLRNKIVLAISLLLVIIGLVVVGPQKISKRVFDYLESNASIVLQGKKQEYHFVNTLNSVAEAQQVENFSVNEDYVGIMPYVILSSFGFILLLLAQPLFLMALPMMALGYMASFTGIRFTMFATPALALGFAGLAFILAQFLAKYNKKLRYGSILISLLGVGLMVVNVLNVNSFFTPTAFTRGDVKVLREFALKSKPDDLLVSWWDYGWPLWYYTGRNNTLIDNGRHGADTYLVANLLLSKEKDFTANALEYFGAKQRGNSSILPDLIHKEDIVKRFEDLKKSRAKVSSKRNIYFMLHRNMLLTFKTLEDFAYNDLKTGKKTQENSQLYISSLLRPYSKKTPMLYGDTFDFDLRNGMIKSHDGASTQIQGVIIVEKNKVVAAKRYNPRSPMTLIIYNKTKAIYLDYRALNSFLIKALLFDQYDKNRFTKVAESDTFKILKLK